MQIHYAIVRKSTGEIMQVGEAPDYAAGTLNPDDDAFDVIGIDPGEVSDRLEFYDHGAEAFAPRPVLDIPATAEISADGEDAFVAAGLPAGTSVRFDGEEYVIEDGSFEVSMEVPGRYIVDILPPFPHRKHRVELTAR